MKKRSSRTHKECLNKLFFLMIFITNILVANVYKMLKCDKNQMFYYNVKSFKNENFGNFGQLIEHGHIG